MNTPKPPRPDTIRAIERGFGWIDHRFKWFWEDLAQGELLLYFFLATTSNEQGCSWWSNRKICKVLKVGPATLIRARQTLEQRRLIATTKDPLSQRIIYQVLPLPIDQNVRIEIPIKPSVQKKSPKKPADKAKTRAVATEDDRRSSNLKNLQKMQQMLREL